MTTQVTFYKYDIQDSGSFCLLDELKIKYERQGKHKIKKLGMWSTMIRRRLTNAEAQATVLASRVPATTSSHLGALSTLLSLALMHVMMSLASSRTVAGALRSITRFNGADHARSGVKSRAFATSASSDGTLPLKGFKVLDMTRVLAGVRSCISLASVRVDHFVAILHTDTRRFGVR